MDMAAGSIDQFLQEAYARLRVDYPKFYKMDNLSKAGFLGAEVLFSGRKIAEDVGAENVALVFSNAHASLDTDVRYAASAKTVASPALFVYTLSNIVAGEVCIRHGLKGENAFFISSQFDEVLTASYAELVPARVVIAGWIDVMSDRHDVFLYLLDKNAASGIPHSPAVLKEIYTNALWNN